MTERESQYPFEKKYGLMFEKFKFVELIVSQKLCFSNMYFQLHKIEGTPSGVPFSDALAAVIDLIQIVPVTTSVAMPGVAV